MPIQAYLEEVSLVPEQINNLSDYKMYLKTPRKGAHVNPDSSMILKLLFEAHEKTLSKGTDTKRETVTIKIPKSELDLDGDGLCTALRTTRMWLANHSKFSLSLRNLGEDEDNSSLNVFRACLIVRHRRHQTAQMYATVGN